MAIQMDAWWANRNNLEQYGIESMYDSMNDTIVFRKRIFNEQMLQYANESVPMRDLHNGYYKFGHLLDSMRYHERSSPEYVHPGPTNRDLRNPAIRNAWEEFQIIHRLGRDY